MANTYGTKRLGRTCVGFLVWSIGVWTSSAAWGADARDTGSPDSWLARLPAAEPAPQPTKAVTASALPAAPKIPQRTRVVLQIPLTPPAAPAVARPAPAVAATTASILPATLTAPAEAPAAFVRSAVPATARLPEAPFPSAPLAADTPPPTPTPAPAPKPSPPAPATDTPSADGERRGRREGQGRGRRESNNNNAEEQTPPPPPELEARPSGGEYAGLGAFLVSRPKEEREVFYYQCRNIRATTLKNILNDFVKGSGMVADGGETDLVVVSDTPEQIALIKQICERVDQRVPQILVEAQIVELTIEDNFEKDIDWNFMSGKAGSFVQELLGGLSVGDAAKGGGSGKFRPYYHRSANGDITQLTAFFRFLETRNKAKILSSPNLILRRGVTGKIFTGEEVPIMSQTSGSGGITTSTTFKEVGIKLDVQPIMIRDDTVRVQVKPEVAVVLRWDTSGDVRNPVIGRRNADTELEMKDGELLAIGGLLSEEETTDGKRIPVLSSIPGAGSLFRGSTKKTTKKQLIIFLQIRILDESAPGDVNIHRPVDLHPEVQAESDRLDEVGKRSVKSSMRFDIRRFTRESEDM